MITYGENGAGLRVSVQVDNELMLHQSHPTVYTASSFKVVISFSVCAGRQVCSVSKLAFSCALHVFKFGGVAVGNRYDEFTVLTNPATQVGLSHEPKFENQRQLHYRPA